MNPIPHSTPKLSIEMDISQIVEHLYHLDKERIYDFGGKEVDNLINEKVRDELARQVLQAEHDKKTSAVIRIYPEDERLFFELS